MSSNLDDTQPRSPFKNPPVVEPFRRMETDQPFTYGEEADQEPELEPQPRQGAGCLPMAVIGLIGLGFAGMIVLLAGFAGWTIGQRSVQANATATRGALISEQINRFPADAASRNFYAMEVRLSFLATQTPGVPGVADFIGTATAVFQTAQPTATLPASSTPQPQATQPPAQVDSAGTPAPAGLDLTALLTQAESDMGVQNWESAIETLQLIESTDPTFQRDRVRGQLFTALTGRALGLLRSSDVGDMAEGVRLTDLAADYGDISVSEVNYEAYIAGLYLNARSAIGLDYSRAIQSLSVLYNTAPNYRDVGQLLFSQYVGYGDAWTAQANWCAAAAQYQSALTLFNDVGVTSKLSAAQTACQSIPPGTTPGAPGTSPFPGITPVGVG
jgi:hypothetical protein